MASRTRRNAKTHPKPTGEDAQDDFMPPDRPDRETGEDDGRSAEVVDVFGKAETVALGGDDDAGVDQNSAGEGDARAMSSEGEGDAGDDDPPGGNGVQRPAPRGSVRGTRRDTSRGDGEGADSEPYSARVRKRIARERAVANRERTLREQTQRELTEERTARQAQDERIARLERATTEVAQNAGVKDLEAQLAALKPQLVAALEGGESAKAADLSDKIGDLKAKLEVVRYDLHQRQKAAEAAAANRSTTTTAATSDTSDTMSEAERARAKAQSNLFWRQNRHWANRTANKEAADDVVNIDKEILADIESGELEFDKYSDEHFDELAHRLHETYPDLEIQDLDGQPYNFDDEKGEDDMNDGQRRGSGNNTGQRGPTRGAAPMSRRGQNGRQQADEVALARQGKVRLTQADFKQMRTYGLDPNDPKAKKYFANERRRTLLGGGPRPAGGDR